MNHLKWMGHTSTILDIQKSLRNDLATCDVNISSGGKSVKAHRFVLSSASDLLRDILEGIPLNQEATIIIPDTRDNILTSILSFIYIGEVQLSSANLSDFLETTNILGIKSAISFECNPTKIKEDVSAMETSEMVEGDEEAVLDDKDTDEDPSAADQPREFEYLDVYNNEPDKISYTIEHIEAQCQGSSSTGEYILTEAGGTYTLTAHGQGKLADGSIIEKGDDGLADIEMTSELETSTKKDVTTVKPKMIKKLKSETIDIVPSTSTAVTGLNKSCPTFSEALGTKIGALDGAVDAVVTQGMSLQKAASKFSISKTVLWRRVKKHPQYMKSGKENPILEAAYEKLKSGESLKNISLALDIPMSTLHRHKVRLSAEGRLPENVSFKKRGDISKQDLRQKLSKAVEACLNGMSQNHAANVYEVPKSTLWRHLQKVAAVDDGQQVFIKKEDEVVEEDVTI